MKIDRHPDRELFNFFVFSSIRDAAGKSLWTLDAPDSGSDRKKKDKIIKVESALVRKGCDFAVGMWKGYHFGKNLSILIKGKGLNLRAE